MLVLLAAFIFVVVPTMSVRHHREAQRAARMQAEARAEDDAAMAKAEKEGLDQETSEVATKHMGPVRLPWQYAGYCWYFPR